MIVVHKVAHEAAIHVTAQKHQETFYQFVWWAGYIHNLKPPEIIIDKIESAYSVLKRNFYVIEHQLRYIYDCKQFRADI